MVVAAVILLVLLYVVLYMVGWHYYGWSFEMWGQEFECGDLFVQSGTVLSTLFITVVVMPVAGVFSMIELLLQLVGYGSGLLPIDGLTTQAASGYAPPTTTENGNCSPDGSSWSDGSNSSQLSVTVNPMFQLQQTKEEPADHVEV